jgi:prevent-host-death family protein
MDLVHDLVHNENPMEVNVHEAKTNFSKLLQRVILGDEIIIAKAGVPVAKLVRYVSKKGKRPLGFLKGEIWMADDFDAPLPPDILAGFLGEKEPEKQPVKKAQPARKKHKRA